MTAAAAPAAARAVAAAAAGPHRLDLGQAAVQLTTGSSRRRGRVPDRPRAIPAQAGEAAALQAARRARRPAAQDDLVAAALDELGPLRARRLADRLRE